MNGEVGAPAKDRGYVVFTRFDVLGGVFRFDVAYQFVRVARKHVDEKRIAVEEKYRYAIGDDVMEEGIALDRFTADLVDVDLFAARSRLGR